MEQDSVSHTHTTPPLQRRSKSKRQRENTIEKTVEKTQDKMQDKMQDKIHEKPQEKTVEKIHEMPQEKMQEKIQEKTQEKPQVKMQEKTRDKRSVISDWRRRTRRLLTGWRGLLPVEGYAGVRVRQNQRVEKEGAIHPRKIGVPHRKKLRDNPLKYRRGWDAETETRLRNDLLISI